MPFQPIDHDETEALAELERLAEETGCGWSLVKVPAIVARVWPGRVYRCVVTNGDLAYPTMELTLAGDGPTRLAAITQALDLARRARGDLATTLAELEQLAAEAQPPAAAKEPE